MKNRVKIITILLTAFLTFSCSNNNNNRELKDNEIRDASGTIIRIPENPKEATAASVYAVSTPFFLALNITNRVLAINTKKAFIKNQDEYLKKAGSVGNGVVDLEKLATYNPTALIHRSNDPKTVKSVKNLGIEVITITVENVEDTKSTLKMLGKYFGVDERAEYVCNWIDKEFTYIDNIVNKIPESEKVSALVMGGELGRVAGNDMLQTWMINKAGGKAVIDEGKDHNWINVGVEKVFTLNPEYIFCTSSTALDYTKEEIYSNSAWSAMTSVQNKNIYTIPATNDSWDMPGISPVLGTLYMLRTMYPNYFSLEDFYKHIDEYYTFMFNKTFTKEELGYEIS